MTKKLEPMLWLSDARGVYIPRDFVNSMPFASISDVDDTVWPILEAGPEHEDYWEAWQEVLDNAIIKDDKDQTFRLFQDGNLWLVPVGMEWSEKEDWFVWPREQVMARKAVDYSPQADTYHAGPWGLSVWYGASIWPSSSHWLVPGTIRAED